MDPGRCVSNLHDDGNVVLNWLVKLPIHYSAWHLNKHVDWVKA